MPGPSKIVIEEYSPQWAEIFLQLKTVFEIKAGKFLSGIHHVGSTSVPGLPAKPIIDIDLVIDEKEHFGPVKSILDDLGYDHAGDLGIDEREVFKRRDEFVPWGETQREWPLHNLYVCRNSITALKNHLAFRDYLRENPVKRDEYGALKKQIAAAHPHDIDAYVREKTDFVIKALRAKGFSEEELSGIIAQNKAIGR
ncbi:MAG TPA: GrpB family protein [Bacteroidia bacterium]|nr:GrpB family protein [Bacteroidia bacterium]